MVEAEPGRELGGEGTLGVLPHLLEADDVGVEAGERGRDGGPACLPGPESPPEVPRQHPQAGLDQRSVGPLGVRHGLSIPHAGCLRSPRLLL